MDGGHGKSDCLVISKQLPTFVVEELPAVSDIILFSKLTRNGVCGWDEFFAKYAKSHKSDLIRIQGILQQVARTLHLPGKKWHPLGKPDGEAREFEAKSGDLRLYAVKLSSGYVVIIGGIKGNQKRDIRRLRTIKDEYLKSLKKPRFK
jgi:hypothetical protein